MAALFEFLQGASNAAASNVSGPVDVISWALRRLGIPVGEAPVGSSQWMTQKGLTKQTRGMPGLLGEAAGLSLPIVAAAKAPQIASGLLAAQENAAIPRTMSPQAGAIVYHGSPHKFDKFDSSKIGTGEGAQAYGHGLYLADAPDVAGYYQKTGINATPSIRKGGIRVEDELLSSLKPGDNVFISQINADTPRGRVLSEKDLAKVKESLAHHADLYAGSPREAYYRDALNRFDELKAKVIGGKFGYEEGNLYKVDLPDTAIAKMLDWDKPLSQQAPEVKKALAPLIEKATVGQRPGFIDADFPAQGLVRLLSKDAMGGAKEAGNASEALRKAGIPGIRYLDQGSRGAGQGTYNYVVFPGEESLLKILERK